jgi:transmembrane sensor
VLDRGEALFSVAPDPERPFEVNAGSGVITAVGTAFNVRRREDNEVVVTVTDGIVEIAPISMEATAPMSPLAIPTLSLGGEAGSAPGAARTEEEKAETANAAGDERAAARRLVRGQQATYDAEGKIGAVRLVHTNVSTVWRDGRLKYQGEPLRHVIEDVNRYSRRKLVLEDPSAGTLLYSGTVFARDINDWIAGLERIYPEIEAVITDDGRVLIRTRDAQSNIG